MNVFVTFDQFNAFLLSKMTIIFKIMLTPHFYHKKY